MVSQEIKAMPLAERLLLVEDIWDSIAEEQNALPFDAGIKAVLEERLAALKADPSAGSTWEEVKKRLSRR
ncbi:MAG: addiction module protein [Spirochaetota bacterium]